MDQHCDLATQISPSAGRPLLGLTILVVEDSRLTSETLRLMCLRSGARIRRADCLASARRHLQVYRPSAVITDMGLPDGSGAELIRDLAGAVPRVGVLLGMSGDDGAGARALAAGADGFLAKPFNSLTQFQEAILAHLPGDHSPEDLCANVQECAAPDMSAFVDDMSHVAAILEGRQDGPTIAYVTQFLSGVARSAHDLPLEKAADELARCGPGEGRRRKKVAELMQMVRARSESRAAI